ncbi:MAG: COX15/CtaA family protein, partial [Phycisphaeraceae bacterium]|nr:COX15/CtaA family protein [Phycisphaeraceae bacterium]
TSLAIIHGIVGQVFLCLLVLIAAATSRWWIEHAYPTGDDVPTPQQVQGLRLTSILLLGVLLVQLTLGAMIRHTQSTLAIPDFPASYGQLLPPLSEPGIAAATQRMMGEVPPGYLYPSPSQVLVHFTHRVWAVVVLLTVGIMLLQIAKSKVKLSPLLRPAAGLGVLLIIQITLGAAVIWAADLTGHPEIATSHQALGAILLACAALLAFRIHRAYPWTDPMMLETLPPLRPFAAMEQPSA